MERIVCTLCGREGHYPKDCPLRPSPEASYSRRTVNKLEPNMSEDTFLVSIADAVLRHIDAIEETGKKSNPMIVFSREGRLRAQVDRRFFEFFDTMTTVEDLPFMGYPTCVDVNQDELFIVREQ